jgi:hypothetical protein
MLRVAWGKEMIILFHGVLRVAWGKGEDDDNFVFIVCCELPGGRGRRNANRDQTRMKYVRRRSYAKFQNFETWRSYAS